MQELPYSQIWLCEREPVVPYPFALLSSVVHGVVVDPDAETGIRYMMCADLKR